MSHHEKPPPGHTIVPAKAPSSTKATGHDQDALPYLGDDSVNVERVLGALVEEDGFLGAALIGRDGVPVVMRFSLNCNQEASAAMGAAILGAADAALTDMTGEEVERFAVESRSHRYLGSILDDELAILLVTKSTISIDSAYSLLDEASKTMKEILAED